MTSAIISIAGSFLLFAGIVILAFENRKISRLFKTLSDSYLAAVKAKENLSLSLTDLRLCVAWLPDSGAEVEENEKLHFFTVHLRKNADGEKFPIRHFNYDPADPEDREYKRTHAHEVADLLNEKP